jgi:type IV fimbrial biogenesis protein FimT
MLKRMLKFSRGFSLTELMIAITIMSLLVALAGPSFSRWISNAKIRTAAEAILSGLQLARTEALNRNAVMRFQLVSSLDGDCGLSDTGPHWIVSRDDPEGLCGATPVTSDMTADGEPASAPRIVQKYDGAQAGGEEAKIIDAAGQAVFTFNGMGRLTSPAASIQVYGAKGENGCISNNGKDRCMRIDVSQGGGIKLCDPSLPSTNVQACQ